MLNQLCLQSYFILQWQDARSPLKQPPPSHPFTQQTITYPPKFNHQNHARKKLKFGFNPQSFSCVFLQPKAPWSSKIIRARCPARGESVWRGGPEDGGGRSRQLSRPRKWSVREPLCGGALLELCWGRFCGMIARECCVFVCCLVEFWGWIDEMMY